MISRRAALGGAAAATVVAGAAGAHALGVDDDVLRALGARPRPIPDTGDTALLTSAAGEQAEVVASLDALLVAYEDPDLQALRDVAAEQLEGLGGADLPTVAEAQDERSAATAAVATLVDDAEQRSRRDALAARSPALMTVLASLSAGRAQLARRLEELA
ncbi:hypothetical protein ACHAAC_15235 [Aeromicrobium sp. CF4.19]|uniref:hypothetical protein n=1 Tax=Aeromicrobium sp. CF4.19 TaxID=3373082 RepID=UPI003EE56DE1